MLASNAVANHVHRVEENPPTANPYETISESTRGYDAVISVYFYLVII